MNFYYYIFIFIIICFAQPIKAADYKLAVDSQYELKNEQFCPVEPILPKAQSQPRYNRILYKMGMTIFALTGNFTLILILFSILSSRSRGARMTIIPGSSFYIIINLLIVLFSVIYAVVLIDQSVMLQSNSRQANWPRAKRRLLLAIPLLFLYLLACFLSWYFVFGAFLIYFNFAMFLLIAVFIIWDLTLHQLLPNQKTNQSYGD